MPSTLLNAEFIQPNTGSRCGWIKNTVDVFYSSVCVASLNPLLFSVCLTLYLSVSSEDEDPEYKPLRMPFKDDLDDFTNSPLDDKDDAMEGESEGGQVVPPAALLCYCRP